MRGGGRRYRGISNDSKRGELLSNNANIMRNEPAGWQEDTWPPSTSYDSTDFVSNKVVYHWANTVAFSICREDGVAVSQMYKIDLSKLEYRVSTNEEKDAANVRNIHIPAEEIRSITEADNQEEASGNLDDGGELAEDETQHRYTKQVLNSIRGKLGRCRGDEDRHGAEEYANGGGILEVH